MIVAAKHQDALARCGLATLEQVQQFRGPRIKVHRGRRDILQIESPPLFLKRNWKPYKKDGFVSWLRHGQVWSQSRREWENSLALQRAGLRTAELVAYGEDCGPLWERFSFIITEPARGERTVEQFLRDCRDPTDRRRVFDALAREIRKMHDAGLASPDLFTRHIFVDASRDPPQFCLIDVARLDRQQPLSARRRARDLAALNITAPRHYATEEERKRFMEVYGDKSLCPLIERRMQHLARRPKFQDFFRNNDPNVN